MTLPRGSQAVGYATARLFGGDDRGHVPDDGLSQWLQLVGLQYSTPAGVTLFSQGALCQQILYIEEGWVVLSRIEDTGVEMTIGVCQAGAILGASAALSHGTHPATATTRTSTKLRGVPLATLERALREEPRIAREMLRELGHENVMQTARCGALGSLGAAEHFERLLDELTSSARLLPTHIPLTVGDLAGLVGVDVSHMRRLVRRLRREGVVIETTAASITIHDVRRPQAS